MSRRSPASPESEAVSATERGIEESRAEPPVLLALLAPGNGIPARAPLGPMALCVDRIMEGQAALGFLAQQCRMLASKKTTASVYKVAR